MSLMNVSSTCYILLFRVCIKANLKRTDSKDLNNGPINNGTIQIMDILPLEKWIYQDIVVLGINTHIAFY